MAIKKILVPLSGQYDPDDPESLEIPALETGFLVGREFDAHVEVFCIATERSQARSHLAPWVPGSAIDDLLGLVAEESEKRRAQALAAFEAAMDRFEPARFSRPVPGGGFSAAFLEHAGEVGGALAVRGRLADLIVTSSPPRGWDGQRPLMLEVALRETGRPVLVCCARPVKTFGRRVAIAWNGSAEAARAVAFAMDFLVAADEVVVISVNEAGPFEPDAENLADYLLWHGVRARSAVVEGTAHGAGEILLQQLDDAAADMLVMGAYTRDRIRRLIYGGVTGAVLSEVPVPVLMVD